MEIKGNILVVGEVQEFSSGFRKREVVIETGDQYPNPIPVEFIKEKADDFDGQPGDMIRCDINLRGREWNNRYFCNIQAWRWDLDRQQKPPEPAKKEEGPLLSSGDSEEEVPF